MPDATGLDARRASQAGPMGGNGEGSTVQAVERGLIRLGKAIAGHRARAANLAATIHRAVNCTVEEDRPAAHDQRGVVARAQGEVNDTDARLWHPSERRTQELGESHSTGGLRQRGQIHRPAT
jgi:hypothetical protein